MHAPQVNVTTDPDMGTIYSVAVPIKRVKPTARVPMGGARSAAERTHAEPAVHGPLAGSECWLLGVSLRLSLHLGLARCSTFCKGYQ